MPETDSGTLTMLKLPGDEFVTLELVHPIKVVVEARPHQALRAAPSHRPSRALPRSGHPLIGYACALPGGGARRPSARNWVEAARGAATRCPSSYRALKANPRGCTVKVIRAHAWS